MKREYRHGEAFCLMWYGCICGHRERIWNSRDGVTPFCLACPSCGEPRLQHIEWDRDRRRPNHTPHHGQRFFRDGTPDEAEAIMRHRIEKMRGQYPVEPDHERELLELAKTGRDRDGSSNEFQKGWPLVDRHHAEGSINR